MSHDAVRSVRNSRLDCNWLSRNDDLWAFTLDDSGNAEKHPVKPNQVLPQRIMDQESIEKR